MFLKVGKIIRSQLFLTGPDRDQNDSGSRWLGVTPVMKDGVQQ